MSWDSDVYTCPHCNRDDLVLASGPRRAKILIIGEFPGDDEIKKGKPLVGATGKVLRNELARVDLDMNQMRLTNLWLHPPQKVHAKDIEGQKRKEQCFKYGLDQAIKEARGKYIAIMDSDDISRLNRLELEVDLLEKLREALTPIDMNG